MKNKVKFGIKNVHYTCPTVSEGTVVYTTPTALPGAVSLSISPIGDMQNIAADDDPAYVTISSQGGYSGNLILYQLPDSFITDVLGYTSDSTNKTMYKIAGAARKTFALLYEIGGDQVPTRYILYHCAAGDPEITTTTNADNVTANEISIPITVTAAEDTGVIRAYAEKQETTSAYDTWFTSVYVPTVTKSVQSPAPSTRSTATSGK